MKSRVWTWRGEALKTHWEDPSQHGRFIKSNLFSQFACGTGMIVFGAVFAHTMKFIVELIIK